MLNSTEHESSAANTEKLRFFLAFKLAEFAFILLINVAFILLINVKMPTIVGILTFMSRINFVLS